MRQHALLGLGALSGMANAKCDAGSIQALLPSGASVNFARSVAANSTFVVPKSDTGYPANAEKLPSLCAVSVQVKSIGNSTYGFGMFLPDDWNGRFLGVGNGGFGGGINYEDMVRAPRTLSLTATNSSRDPERNMASQ
jgi:feruloyl esterase